MLKTIFQDISTVWKDRIHHWLVDKLMDEDVILIRRELDSSIILYSYLRIGPYWIVYRLEYRSGYSEWSYLEMYPYFKILTKRLGISRSLSGCDDYVVADILCD